MRNTMFVCNHYYASCCIVFSPTCCCYKRPSAQIQYGRKMTGTVKSFPPCCPENQETELLVLCRRLCGMVTKKQFTADRHSVMERFVLHLLFPFSSELFVSASWLFPFHHARKKQLWDQFKMHTNWVTRNNIFCANLFISFNKINT